MLNKKLYSKFINEKSDKFNKIPLIMPPKQMEELKKIPRLAIGEVASAETMVVLYESLKNIKVDAVIPTIVYTSTGYGEQESIWKNLSVLKRNIEKTLKIYCTEPVILGSRRFWWALNGRFMQELLCRYKVNSPCFGCRIYRYALEVPLCKALNVKTLISGSINRKESNDKFYETNAVINYCKKLLSNFGINLIYTAVDKDKREAVQNLMPFKYVNGQDDCYPCILEKNYQVLNGMYEEPTHLNQFFEQYLIPATAKIISKALSGRDFDYLDEVVDTLLPGEKARTYKKTFKDTASRNTSGSILKNR